MKAIRALLLVLAISVCAYAEGVMPTDKTGVMPTDKTGEMDNGKISAVEPVTATVLQLVQSLLSLF